MEIRINTGAHALCKHGYPTICPSSRVLGLLTPSIYVWLCMYVTSYNAYMYTHLYAWRERERRRYAYVRIYTYVRVCTHLSVGAFTRNFSLSMHRFIYWFVRVSVSRAPSISSLLQHAVQVTSCGLPGACTGALVVSSLVPPT